MLVLAKAYRLGALTSALAIVLAGASAPVAAQGVPQRSSMPRGALRPQPTLAEPVVQPLPKREGMALDTALGRLARDPRDIDALIDAGNAALVMGDVDAATGFFRRADQVSPGNPRAKAGLAGAMVHNGDPFGAIPLFDEAEKAGALDTALAADRGLAYDLVGDNATAQRYYRQALARGANDEVVRRLALSLAISGDKPGAEATLSPLLQHRDLAAWRTRAFALAILGQTEEAVSIANTILPADLAGGIAPYLRYMPRLTHAQQAAAANFGSFPRASEIGRDDPRVADYAPKRGSVAAADTALMPQGEPFGRKARARDRDRSSRTQASERAPVLPAAAASPGTDQTKPARIAPPEPLPAREVASSPAARTPVAAAPAPARPPKPAPQLAMAAKPVSAPIQPRGGPPSAAAEPRSTVSDMLPVAPGFSLAPSAPLPSSAPVAAPASPPPAPPVSRPAAPVVQSPPPAPVRAPVAVAPSPAPVPRSLAEAFAEFNRPSTDATPAAGAVDLRRIKPTRPEAKKPAEPPKPPPPSHPSRIWVQLATGRDKAALGYDWRRMTREKAELLRGKAPFVSAWGQTNRLLTGPFQSEAAANSFIAQLRRADVDGAFVWTSPAGQVVDALAAAAPRH